MRRKDRSGPGIINCDEFVTNPSGGEVAAVSDEFETSKAAKTRSSADRQPQERTKATTTMERQRGNFTAGFLLEPAAPKAIRSASRRAGDCHSIREAEIVLDSQMCVIPAPDSKFQCRHNNPCF